MTGMRAVSVQDRSVQTSDRRRILRALLVDVFRLSFAGYVVLQVVAVLYWVFSTRPFSVVVSAAGGGAVVAFVLVPPPYVAMGYAIPGRREPALRHPASQEEVPAPA